MIIAVVMAGGRSTRMRASAGNEHKALVPILGVTMLERNLCQLLSAGFRDIAVAVSCVESALIQFVEQVGQPLASAVGANLKCVVEEIPLGTIGITRRLLEHADEVIVVNVDNLCSLDLNMLVEHHRQSGSAITVATHVEAFQIPFGEVEVSDGRIRRYLEKSVQPVQISSGIYVLSDICREFSPADEAFDVPSLINRLVAANHRVGAFSHQSVWIDVNDKSAVERAERLLRENGDAFAHVSSRSMPNLQQNDRLFSSKP